jgi:hypothetical protein
MIAISANVRKNIGRPRIIDEALFASIRREFPADSYRKICERLRVAKVRRQLAEVCGENVLTSCADGIECRPKQAARWPWLLGRRVQHTVLFQLVGLPTEALVAIVDQIESLHREKGWAAKRLIPIARRKRQYWIDVACLDAGGSESHEGEALTRAQRRITVQCRTTTRS